MTPSISTKDDKIIVLADHHIANRKLYRERIWLPARAMHEEVGSYAAWRRVLAEIEDYDGRLYFPDQRPFRHPEVTDMFPDVCSRHAHPAKQRMIIGLLLMIIGTLPL